MTAENLGERLRRLRRPKDFALPDAAHGDGELGVRERLARRAGRARRTAPAPQLEHSAFSERAPRMLGMPSDLERVEHGDGLLLARVERLPSEHRHGALKLVEIARASSRAFALLTRDAALESIDARTALYLDTETSGLSGGSGTYVFMVGLGAFEGESFRIWQGFLDDPAHEKALLSETAERVRAAPAIVSFFGKSFDRHRLEDRMRCLGIEPPFDGKPHLDLYHPLRRLYRGAFADQRLRTLESALCGVERDDDLPGSMAPAAWFDFLAGRPHRLAGVFRHNRDDVLSLVTLAAHLGSVLRLDGAHEAGGDALAQARAVHLARALSESGECDTALGLCDETLACLDLSARRRRELRVLRAQLLQRTGDLVSCVAASRALAEEDEDEHSAAVLLSLARLEKRALGDAFTARATCARAAAVAARRHTGRELARFERALESLSASLERQIARAAAGSRPAR